MSDKKDPVYDWIDEDLIVSWLSALIGKGGRLEVEGYDEQAVRQAFGDRKGMERAKRMGHEGPKRMSRFDVLKRFVFGGDPKENERRYQANSDLKGIADSAYPWTVEETSE